MSTVVNPSTETTPPAPSTRKRGALRIISLVIVVVGLLITGYLSYTRITDTQIVCIGGSSGCDVVRASVWSKLMGIPVEYLCFVLWSIIGAILLLEPRVKFLQDYGYAIVFGLVLFGFTYHCYLTTMSLTRIQATCTWCLSAHTTMGVMLIVSARRLYLNIKGIPA